MPLMRQGANPELVRVMRSKQREANVAGKDSAIDVPCPMERLVRLLAILVVKDMDKEEAALGFWPLGSTPSRSVGC